MIKDSKSTGYASKSDLQQNPNRIYFSHTKNLCTATVAKRNFTRTSGISLEAIFSLYRPSDQFNFLCYYSQHCGVSLRNTEATVSLMLINRTTGTSQLYRGMHHRCCWVYHVPRGTRVWLYTSSPWSTTWLASLSIYLVAYSLATPSTFTEPGNYIWQLMSWSATSAWFMYQRLHVFFITWLVAS